MRFADKLGVSHLPSEHARCVCVLSAFQGLHLTAFALMFCAHMFFVKALSASTICGYLAGVSFNLNRLCEDAIFLSSPQMLMIRAGMRRLQRQRQITPKGKLPFTLEMILAFQKAVLCFRMQLLHTWAFLWPCYLPFPVCCVGQNTFRRSEIGIGSEHAMFSSFYLTALWSVLTTFLPECFISFARW